MNSFKYQTVLYVVMSNNVQTDESKTTQKTMYFGLMYKFEDRDEF